MLQNADNGSYNILSNADFLLSLKYNVVLALPGASSGGISRILIQDRPYSNSPNCSISITASCPDHQRWKFIETGNDTYLIESLAFPGKVLQPMNDDPNNGILLVNRNNSEDQQWLLDTLRFRPSQTGADIGYGPLVINLGDNTPFYVRDNWVDIDAGDVHVANAIADINLVSPQHRSVGELSALNKPKESYEILEGVVQRKDAGIAGSDFPTSHYTHDFCIKVKPDPQFDHLLAATYTVRYPLTPAGNHCIDLERLLRDAQNELSQAPAPQKPFYRQEVQRLQGELQDLCAGTKTTIISNFQKEIEVEWESGLGQDGNNNNPAVRDNIIGNSFGFFSAGHKLRDVIWNWPTVDDRVHVEGIWIWDRGHNAPTEIHPPHFISIQRKLPVSFKLNTSGEPVIGNTSDDKFIATRVDVFGSAEGSAMWNNKGLEDFAQTVNMQRKDYSFTIKHPFSKPVSQLSHNVTLKCRFIIRPGDNFSADPIIQVDNNIVHVTIPWKTGNVSNDAIIARTLLIYWEDVNMVMNGSTKKVTESEKPKLYKVDIIKVNLLTKLDGDGSASSGVGNHGYGDLRIFCNVGSEFIFLNEFDPTISPTNILRSGLGQALSTSTFQINKSFNVYVGNNSAFRISASGWEGDAVNTLLMGHIINEYSRDGEPLNKFFGENVINLDDGGKADESIGSIDKMFSPSNIGVLNTPSTLKAFDGDGRHIFNLVYQISEIPFSATNPGIRPPLIDH